MFLTDEDREEWESVLAEARALGSETACLSISMGDGLLVTLTKDLRGEW